jgi:CSLREA domain-containing protein
MVMVWLLTLAPVPWPVPPVMGATFIVTKTNDTNDGACTADDCSLREAIIAANSTMGSDIIVLQPGQTYTLSLDNMAGNEDTAAEDDLDVVAGSTITIQGNGATIRRDPALTCNLTNGTADTGEFRIFEVKVTGNLTGNLTLQNVTVRNGCADGSGFPDTAGGGILNDGGTLTVMGSTISGNSADFSGGIGIGNAGGTVTVTNSTISGNSADYFGGGIGVFAGTAELSFVTIASNSASTGGGIYNGGSGTVNIKNSIVGNNTASTGPNCSGTVTATGANFATDTATMSCGTTNFTYVSSTGPGGLNLGPLQVNPPGTTATHALLSGSAAVDAVPSGQCSDVGGNTVNKDQRGVARPQDGDGNGTATCDVGAYEAEIVTLQGPGKCLALDLTNNTYVFQTPIGTFMGAIKFTRTSSAIRFRSVPGATPSLSGTINLTRRAGTAILALGLTQWITLVDRNLDDNGSCP